MQATTSYRLSHLSHVILPGILGIGVSACGGGGGSTATSATAGPTLGPFDARVLWCGWKEPGDPEYTHGRKFCIRLGACTSYLSQLCAYNIDGDETAYAKYTPEGPNGEGFAQWDGSCDESCPSEVEAGKATPYCEGVDPVPYDPDVYGACEPPPQGTTGEPTTGAPTTGDDSAGTDSDGPYVEAWVCSELSHENCQDRSGEGALAEDDYCWMASVNASRCVYAATKADAVVGCECLCDIRDEILEDACDSPGVCEIDEHLDCTVPYSDEPKPLGVSTHGCEGKILPWDFSLAMCPNNFRVFDASASLVLAGGISTSVTGVVGYLHYTVSGCSGGSCDLQLDVLEIPATDITNVYLQGSTIGGTYALEDVAVYMKNSLDGTWWSSRQTVTFGGDPFYAEATMTAINVDSVAIPAGPITIGTNQIVGNLDSATSVLTLNFSFAVPGGTASLSLTTR